jgi:hypothetical protein
MATISDRKIEIEKGCPKCVYDFDTYIKTKKKRLFKFCPTCQARLDERIRAEQDFLKMIDDWWGTQKAYYITEEDIEELKSTIKQETKE